MTLGELLVAVVLAFALYFGIFLLGMAVGKGVEHAACLQVSGQAR